MDSKSVVALSIIAIHDGVTGLEIVNRSEGKLGRGLVYITLRALEESGLITSQVGDDATGWTRRFYRITDDGINALAAIQAKAGCAK